MPRRARIVLPGVATHLIQRGNNRGACFFAQDDYRYYLQHLRTLANDSGCAVHAYCLMTNHVHLLLTPDSADGCGRLMKALGQRYVQYVNRTYRRSGTLWEGRFRSCLAQTEDYVLACYRYIELNPVRAAMAAHPRDYPWSSHRVNAEGNASSMIVPHDQYRLLGRSVEERCRRYRGLFNVNLDPGIVAAIRQATNGNCALGNQRFQAEIEAALGRRAHRGVPGRPRQMQ
jgi:putative transposase